MCETQSLCFELAKGLPAAAVALVVAFGTGAIAWRQYRVARAKLNLDLFEKRYELFTMVWAFVSNVTAHGAPPLASPEKTALVNSIPKIEFLFGSAIAGYVQDINSKAAALWVIDQSRRVRSEVVPQEKIDEHRQLLDWFTNEAMEGVRARFGVYLNFEAWR
ncbi:hypothetical protein [Burkholderia cenocepacia]|uniref:hypothetical protein n=1 Tax=Burkholderia cenocepacia TaxID=95486 RepID=UPI0026530908|nr:hypothetical protein [Burkholderia cenocepacia]MDN7645462.1 hypothetical protein [Burkholderia cenocepacia]